MCSEITETGLLQPDFLHQQSCEGWLTRPITPTLRVKRQQTRDERFAPSHANGNTRRLGLALALTEAAVGCFPPKQSSRLPAFALTHRSLTTTSRRSNSPTKHTRLPPPPAVLNLLLLFSPAYRHLVALPHETHTPPNSCPRFRTCARSYVPPAADFSQAPETNTRAPRLVCFAAKTRPC